MSDLTTLANLKTYLGDQATLFSDPFLSSVISAVSSEIEKWLSRSLLTTAYTDTFSGPGGYFVLTRQWPVTAVSSVFVDGSVIPQSVSQVDYGYQFDNRKVYLRGYRFCRGIRNCTVGYIAGYATVPADVEAAVWEACATYLASEQNAAQTGNPTAKMLRAGDTEIQAQVPGIAPGVPIGTIMFTPSVTTALMPYKAVGFSY